MKAGIICTNGLEECEALVTYDLLYRAGIEVKLIGTDKIIKSSHNVEFISQILIDDFDYQNYDCLILPGGMPGTKNLEANRKVSDIIDYFVDNGKLTIMVWPSIMHPWANINKNVFLNV